MSDFIERELGSAVTPETRAEANDRAPRKLRCSQIIECLTEKTNQTAKEIACMMLAKGYIPYCDRNFTAPRLTEMSQAGIVEPVGKKKCKWTGRMVAVYALREEEEPQGISRCIRCVGNWLYGCDPTDALENAGIVKDLKECLSTCPVWPFRR